MHNASIGCASQMRLEQVTDFAAEPFAAWLRPFGHWGHGDSCDLHARGPPAPCARGIADCFRSPAGVRVLNPSGCTVASSPTQRASGAMQCAHPAGAGPGGPRSAAHRCRSHVFSAVEWIMQSYDATSIPSARFLAQPPSSLLVHSGLVESLVGEPGRARGARPVSEVLLRRLLRLRGGVRLACDGGAEGIPHRRGLRPCTRHLRPRVCGALQALP